MHSLMEMPVESLMQCITAAKHHSCKALVRMGLLPRHADGQDIMLVQCFPMQG